VTAVDWNVIADRLVAVMHQMIHEENFYGPDSTRYAEALRRTFGYRAANEQRDRERVFPYERLTDGRGLITQAEADHVRDGHTIVDRMGRETAEQQVKEMRAEVARVYREAAKDLAEMIRDRCNEVSVPSRYRREGVAWAADLIDPAVPKDRFGRTLSPAAESEAVAS